MRPDRHVPRPLLRQPEYLRPVQVELCNLPVNRHLVEPSEYLSLNRAHLRAYCNLACTDLAYLQELWKAAQERDHLPLCCPVLLPAGLRLPCLARSTPALIDKVLPVGAYTWLGRHFLVLVRHNAIILRVYPHPGGVLASH